MGYIVVEDFRVGLDARRDPAVGLPGSLVEAENVVITSGGDCERAKKFVSKYQLDPGKTFGMHATAKHLYVFGSEFSPSVPSGVTYQRLEHPDGLAMTKVLSHKSFDGLPYVVAQFSDGSIVHFYNGEIVDDWIAGVVRPGMQSNDGIAQHLAALIDGHNGLQASTSGNVITIVGKPGVAFDIRAEAEDGGSVDDQTIEVETTIPAIAGVNGVAARGGFTIISGTSNPGVSRISSVKVDGVEILNDPVDWSISHSAMAINVASQIEVYDSVPEYGAIPNETPGRVTVVAGATGASENGKPVTIVVGGDVNVGSVQNMTGGVDEVVGQSQVSTVTIGGTFDPGDKFTVFIDDRPFGYVDQPDPIGTAVFTYRSKMYAVGGSLLNFSAVDNCTIWNRSTKVSEEVPGAGRVNMANQDAGSEDLIGLGIYNDSLAVMSRNAAQIEFVDADPTANQLLQTLSNTGTPAPKSIVSYGNSDTYYLDDNGIRSLRARDATNIAFASDIGSPIDPVLAAHLKTLTDEQIGNACGMISENGRYWLALGNRIYIFSYFPSAKISAWSYLSLDFEVTEMDIYKRKIYARAGDTIYVYGGDDGNTYPDAGEMVSRVRLPYLTAGKPATNKKWEAIDASMQGTWTVRVLLDPNNEGVSTAPLTIGGNTFGYGSIGIEAESTHAAPLFVCDSAGYAKISSVVLHHNLRDAD